MPIKQPIPFEMPAPIKIPEIIEPVDPKKLDIPTENPDVIPDEDPYIIPTEEMPVPAEEPGR